MAASFFRVLMLLNENSVTEDEIKLEKTNSLEGQTKTDEFRKKNNIHSVAYLEDSIVKIWECRATLCHISSRYSLNLSTLEKWYPTKDALQFELVETVLGFSTVLYRNISYNLRRNGQTNQAENNVIKGWQGNRLYDFVENGERSRSQPARS